MFRLNRNERSHWSGNGVHVESELVFMIGRNMHNLSCSMSRRGNCHDNAVAESFFQLLKRERIKRRIYPTRDEARSCRFNLSTQHPFQ